MTDTPVVQPHVLAVVDDLIFAAKITSTAQSVGISVALCKSNADVAQLLDRTRATLFIVDLDVPGPRSAEAIRAAAGHSARPRILAYVSHVREDLARAAAEAGAHEVMPRSRFSRELPGILSRHAKSPEKPM